MTADVPDLPPFFPPAPLPPETEPAAAPHNRPQVRPHRRRILLPLACFIAGGALALMGEAEIHPILWPATDPQPSAQVRAQAKADIAQRGRAAVLGQLTFPRAMQFATSFVTTTAGGLVTFCGTLHPRDRSDATAEIRFLSVNGDRARTFLDVSEPSFVVLWARLCVVNSKVW